MKVGFNRVNFLVKGSCFLILFCRYLKKKKKKEKRIRSPVSQPIIFKQKQKPDHEPFHQDYHDPPVQVKKLGNRYCRKLTPPQNTRLYQRVNFCKNAGTDQQADHPSKKGIERSRSNRAGNRSRTIPKEGKTDSKDETADDIGTN